MAETVDTLFHLVKRVTCGKVDFPGVYKLRRLEDRVPRVKQLLEEDGRFKELLALIPNYDRSKSGAWSQFVNSELMRKTKQEYQQQREAKKTNNVQATGEVSAVEPTSEATVVETTSGAMTAELNISLAELMDYANYLHCDNDLNGTVFADGSETTSDPMLEAAELAAGVAQPQRSAVKRPRELDDEVYEKCQYHLKMIQQMLRATPAESLEQQAWHVRARMSTEALATDLSTFFLKSEPQAQREGPLPAHD